jgi:signal transduction histidine kinase
MVYTGRGRDTCTHFFVGLPIPCGWERRYGDSTMKAKTRLPPERKRELISGSILLLRLMALFLVLAALYWALFMIRSPIVERKWTRSLVVLLFVEAALCIIPFFSGRYGRSLASFARFCLSLVIGFPLAEDFAIESFLLCSVIIDTAVLYPPQASVGVSLVLAGVTLIAQRPFLLWGVPVAAPTPQALGLGMAAAVFTMIMATWIRRQDTRITGQEELLAQLRSMVSRISSANLGFQNYARIIESKSKEDERKRISREIHDNAGYALTNMRMLMESGLRILDPKELELTEILNYTKEQAIQCLEKIRISMRSLRNIERPSVPFSSEVYKIVSHFEIATGTKIFVNYCNLEDIKDPGIRDILYAIIQEGMINALRHGNATAIQILFWMGPGTVTLILRDNGTGSDVINEGVGISGIKERVASVDGSIAFCSSEEGFEINVTVPSRREIYVEN